MAIGLGYTIPGHWDAFGAAIGAVSAGAWHREMLLLLLFASYAIPFMGFALLEVLLLRRWLKPGWLYPAAQSAVLATLIVGLWSPFPYAPTLLIVSQSVVLQVADLGGEVLPLWLLLWVNAAIGMSLVLRAPWRMRIVTGLPLGAMAIAVVGYGAWRVRALDAQEAQGGGATLHAMPLQLDLPNLASVRTMILDREGKGTSALELSRQGLRAAPQCELVVWPEVPVTLDRIGAVCERGPQIAASLQTPVLMQCARVIDTHYQVTAELFVPGAETSMSHAKSSLVPVYEQPLLGDGHVAAGVGGSVFRLDSNRRLAPALCYELHSRSHLRQAALAGGHIVVHMASFTPFERHRVDEIDLAMSRLRAIEFRMPIVRSANRGATGWIDAAGRPRVLSPRLGTTNTCVAVFAPADGPTPFARLAPLAPWLPGALALVVLFAFRSRAP